MSALDFVGGHVLAVDPVPWAQAQMAFTLASHIILVRLGVTWACMTLLHPAGDVDALRCRCHRLGLVAIPGDLVDLGQ